MLLFCYGSLEFANVMRAVTGRTFAGEPAALDGFARYRVRAADYPGLVPESGASTDGTLWRGLDAGALAVLDRFEGALYERLCVDVRVRDGRSVGAHAYVVRESNRSSLSHEPWDKRAFERDRLESFLLRIRLR